MVSKPNKLAINHKCLAHKNSGKLVRSFFSWRKAERRSNVANWAGSRSIDRARNVEIHRLSVCLYTFPLPTYLHTYMSVFLFTCLPTYLLTYLPICMSVCLPVCLSIYLYICLYVYISTYLPICISICLYLCMFVCLSTILTWLCTIKFQARPSRHKTE